MVIAVWNSAESQFTGIPMIRPYQKSEYQAGTQNWDIDQDKSGRLYFANNDGLLVYNGDGWDLFRLPNKTNVRSVAIDSNERIFVGGQNEIGYFKADQMGELQYHSLLDKIPEAYREFEDVWQIELLNNQVFWRASGRLFHTNGDFDSVYVMTQTPITYLFSHDQQVFIQNESGDILAIDQNEKNYNRILENSTSIGLITGYSNFEANKTLLSTESGPIYIINRDTVEVWVDINDSGMTETQITNISVINDQLVAISSVNSGIIILDTAGIYQYTIQKKEGLLSNNVIALFSDIDKNLWAGLSNGICLIKTNSPFTRILPYGDFATAAYDACIFEDKFYLANSIGLFSFDVSNDDNNHGKINDASLIPGTSGQTWGLDVIDNILFLNHSKGLFTISGNTVTKIASETGFWKTLKHPTEKHAFISGTYNGIVIVKFIDGMPSISKPLRWPE